MSMTIIGNAQDMIVMATFTGNKVDAQRRVRVGEKIDVSIFLDCGKRNESLPKLLDFGV